MKTLPKKITFEVVKGCEGNSIYIMDEDGTSGYRLAGPKPWGGGTVINKFQIDTETLLREIENLKKED